MNKTLCFALSALLLAGCQQTPTETEAQKLARLRAEGVAHRSQQYSNNKTQMLASWRAAIETDPVKVRDELHGPYGHILDADIDAVRESANKAAEAVKAKQAAAQKQREKEQAEAAEKARKADLAKRKKEGVRIGMTQQQVIESSWGKPERINKTHTATTTREQWVYGSRSYLYFHDGVLVTIQN